MRKIVVKICLGTKCYVLGSGDLELLDEHLSENLAKHVEVQTSSCLGLCKGESSARSPFVLVNERVVSKATIPDIIEAIKQELAKL